MKKLFVFVGAFAFSLFARAGGQLGNGADVIVCTSGFKTTVELLDIYEARTLYGRQWKNEVLEGQNLELSAVVGIVHFLKLLDQKLPVKSVRIRSYEREFFDEALFLDGIELTDIPDSMEIVIPGGCRLAQLVVQLPSPEPGQRRYTINRDLWKLLDAEGRVGAILHEIIYRDQVSLGHTDSRWTRYLTGLLISKAIQTMTPDDTRALMRRYTKTFWEAGYELAGDSSSNQEIFQVVGVDRRISSRDFSVVDGRYARKGGLLDLTVEGPTSIFNIEVNGLMGMSWGEYGEMKVYFKEGKISKTVSVMSAQNQFSADLVIATQEKGGKLKFESDVILGAAFANGITMRMRHSENGLPFLENANLNDVLEFWGCENGICPKSYFRFQFGPVDERGQCSFSHAQEELTGLTCDGLSIPYRLPVGADPQLAYRFYSVGTISFYPNGDYSFYHSIGGPPHATEFLAQKDGQLVELKANINYRLQFDREGYLLKVYRAP